MPTLNAGKTYPSDADDGDSGVVWSAIIGGAVAAAGLTLIFSPLGTAFGMSWISPWHGSEPGKAFTAMSAVWLILVQWLSSGLGGYLTGRLRTKWIGAHTHEVFFRDTAHGFLSWALASVVGAILVVSVFSHMAGAASRHGDQEKSSPASYYSESLFRSGNPTDVTEQDRTESAHILAMGAVSGKISQTDENYLSSLIAARTGISQADAQARVEDTLARQKVAVEAARKTIATASLFICLSLLIGAFVASAAGALGGRHRDLHYQTGSLIE